MNPFGGQVIIKVENDDWFDLHGEEYEENSCQQLAADILSPICLSEYMPPNERLPIVCGLNEGKCFGCVRTLHQLIYFTESHSNDGQYNRKGWFYDCF